MVRKLFTSSLVVLASALLALPTVAFPDNGVPIVISTGSSFVAGQQQNMTLTQQSASSSDLYYSVSVTPSTDFTAAPTQVEIPAGQTVVNFNVTLSGSATGLAQVGASGNGESANLSKMVQPD